MRKKNFLSEKDKEIVELSATFELAQAKGTTPYFDSNDLANLADWYSYEGNRDKALEVVDYGLRLHPDDPDLLIQRVYIYLDYDELDEAIDAFEEIGDDADPDEMRLLEANICMMEGDDEKMEQLLNEIDLGQSVHFLSEAAYLYADSEQPEKGISLLEPYRMEYGDNESYLAILGDCYQEAGRYDESIETYNRLLDQVPFNPMYWCAQARSYSFTHAFDKAIDACDYALAIDEDCIDAYSIRGHCFHMLGNDEEAQKSFRALEDRKLLNPLAVAAMRALELVAMERWDEALAEFERVIKNADTSFELMGPAYSNAALCAYHTGDANKAFSYIRKGHTADPNNAEIYLAEGEILMWENRPVAGLRALKKATQLSDTEATWFSVGETCYWEGQYKHARTAYEKALAIAPDFIEINRRLAIVCAILGDFKAFKKYNAQSDPPLTFSNCLAELGDMSDSEESKDILKAVIDMLGKEQRQADQ